MPKAPQYPVPALEKGLDIIEALAAAVVPQSLTELATQLERSSSELFRMLNCLERRGYITREPLSGKYGLTLKLYTLAHTHSIMDKLLHAALPPMQALTEKVRESCHLSVLDHGKLVVVAQEESPERVRLSIEVGGSFEPALTASGRLLLAQLGEEECAAVLASSKVGRELTGRALETFRSALAEVRRSGLSAAESETIEGVRDLAVLIGNSNVGIVGALAVTRLLRRGHRGDEGTLIEAMRTTAATITKSLGLSVAA